VLLSIQAIIFLINFKPNHELKNLEI